MIYGNESIRMHDFLDKQSYLLHKTQLSLSESESAQRLFLFSFSNGISGVFPIFTVKRRDLFFAAADRRRWVQIKQDFLKTILHSGLADIQLGLAGPV